MITVIVIPADRQLPLRCEQLAADDLDGFRSLVGGHLEAVGLSLSRSAATLFVNEEGKNRGLPPNPRATTLAWAHNSAFRGTDVLVGDTVLAGPPDHTGDTTSAPDDLVTLLLRTPRVRVQTKRRASGGWAGGRRTFDDVFDAYRHALPVLMGDRQVTAVRVVPAPEGR